MREIDRPGAQPTAQALAHHYADTAQVAAYLEAEWSDFLLGENALCGDDPRFGPVPPTFYVEVARKITYPKNGFVIKGKVTPNYGKKKIVIKVSKKQNKGYKKFKTIKTTSAGKYKITLPRRGGTWYWSFVVKGDSKYLANGFVWKTFVS